MADFSLDAARCVLIVQDMQNDVIIEGGAFAESGSPQHAKEQNVVENVEGPRRVLPRQGDPRDPRLVHRRRGRARAEGQRAALRGRRTPARSSAGRGERLRPTGSRPRTGDFVVEKMRMSAWQGTKLENLLAGLGRDTIIVTGAWTNMSIEHTSRTGADKGYYMVVPEDGCSTMNADWHNASINFALQNVSTVTNCADVKAALA